MVGYSEMEPSSGVDFFPPEEVQLFSLTVFWGGPLVALALPLICRSYHKGVWQTMSIEVLEPLRGNEVLSFIPLCCCKELGVCHNVLVASLIVSISGRAIQEGPERVRMSTMGSDLNDLHLDSQVLRHPPQ